MADFTPVNQGLLKRAHFVSAGAAGAMLLILQSAVYQFDIPSQPLGNALRSFGVASHQAIAFNETIVRGRISSAVSGQYTADDALGRMLQGTGLVAARTGRGVYIVSENSSS